MKNIMLMAAVDTKNLILTIWLTILTVAIVGALVVFFVKKFRENKMYESEECECCCDDECTCQENPEECTCKCHESENSEPTKKLDEDNEYAKADKVTKEEPEKKNTEEDLSKEDIVNLEKFESEGSEKSEDTHAEDVADENLQEMAPVDNTPIVENNAQTWDGKDVKRDVMLEMLKSAGVKGITRLSKAELREKCIAMNFVCPV